MALHTIYWCDHSNEKSMTTLIIKIANCFFYIYTVSDPEL